MRAALVLLALPDDPPPAPQAGPHPEPRGGAADPDALGAVPGETLEERRRRARELLEKAAAAARKEDPAAKGPAGARVDKYFGSKLPPVCARLGCYVTDDGKRFYCINAACQKHLKRVTKHTREGRPEKPRFAYFRCPRCESRDIEMHVFSNNYSCRACLHVWKR